MATTTGSTTCTVVVYEYWTLDSGGVYSYYPASASTLTSPVQTYSCCGLVFSSHSLRNTAVVILC